MKQPVNQWGREFVAAAFLLVCLLVTACGNSDTAESTQPDPGLNAEESTAGMNSQNN